MRSRIVSGSLLIGLLVSCGGRSVEPDAAGLGSDEGGSSGVSNVPSDAGTTKPPEAGTTTSEAGAGDSGTSTMTPVTPLDPTQIPTPDPNAVVLPNLDSAIIKVEPVAGAKDYRAFVIEDNVQVQTDAQGRETVQGADIFCAGQRQRGAPALAKPVVMDQIEVTNLKSKKTFVVEAIDQLCPFVGLFGVKDSKFEVASPDAIELTPELVKPVPISSEATIRSKYGSFIVNGHGGATQPGQPAAANAPKVLKRWTVEVAPLAAALADQRKTKDFFADFTKNDPPQWVAGGDNPDGTFHAPDDRGYSIAAYKNSDFIFYSTNTELVDRNHVFYDRGQLHMLLPDAYQDVMGTTVAIPRKLAHVDDASYLHVTFEGSTNSSTRRYWWLSVCGPEQAGQTFGADAMLKQSMVLMPGFFGADGLNPSVGRWNCLVVFPHDGIPTNIPANSDQTPQSSVIVLIHKANAPDRKSAVNVSPQQLTDADPRGWYRMQSGTTVTSKGVLDDYIQTAPRVRFDMYISRSRLVMYTNGEQRICNDFGPEKLTMAEAAVGFNDALYHSSAEHTELTVSFYDRSGQLYWLQNEIFADQHTYDNVGFEEHVGLPGSFRATDCYVHKP
jgi:hypothetical protein